MDEHDGFSFAVVLIVDLDRSAVFSTGTDIRHGSCSFAGDKLARQELRRHSASDSGAASAKVVRHRSGSISGIVQTSSMSAVSSGPKLLGSMGRYASGR
jgi:hypothetical protein